MKKKATYVVEWTCLYLFVYPYQWYQISLLVSCMMMLLLGDVILFVLMVWMGAVESSKGTLSYFRSICQSCQGCCSVLLYVPWLVCRINYGISNDDTVVVLLRILLCDSCWLCRRSAADKDAVRVSNSSSMAKTKQLIRPSLVIVGSR